MNKIKDFFKDMFARMTVQRFIFVFVGTFLIGVSVSFSRLSVLGTDPYSCMNIGVANALNKATGNPFWTYGNYQLIVNLVLLIPMFIWKREGLGLGTIVNMIGVGYSSEFVTFLFNSVGFTESYTSEHMVLRVLCMVLALFILTFGVALYMECDLGIAPYDAVAPIMEDKTKGKLKYAISRIITDTICVLIGFLSGNTVGVNTLVLMFGTGPFVAFFRKNVAKKIIK